MHVIKRITTVVLSWFVVLSVITFLGTGTSAFADEMPINSDLAMSLVFDISGSMDEDSGLSGTTKLEAAKRQSIDFVNSIHNYGNENNGGISVQLGVASFSANGFEDCTLSYDPTVVTNAINNLVAWGRTNIYAGLNIGIQQLQNAKGEKLLVLLSDGYNNEGHTNDDIISLAHSAASANIKIFTIGFGPTGEIDENLLREIASITGGSYSHEDSSSLASAAVGLFGAMMGAQLTTQGNLVIEETGSVSQGETVDVGSFTVEQAGTIEVYLYWPGSILDIVLIDPQGKVVDANYTGYSIDTTAIPTKLTIVNAPVGQWNLQVYGRETSMVQEPFWTGTLVTRALPRDLAVTGSGGSSTSGADIMMFVLLTVAITSTGLIYASTVKKREATRNNRL